MVRAEECDGGVVWFIVLWALRQSPTAGMQSGAAPETACSVSVEVSVGALYSMGTNRSRTHCDNHKTLT